LLAGGVTAVPHRAQSQQPTGTIPAWKSILNTLAITYGDRLNIN
jgi:hypothetical protein